MNNPNLDLVHTVEHSRVFMQGTNVQMLFLGSVGAGRSRTVRLRPTIDPHKAHSVGGLLSMDLLSLVTRFRENTPLSVGET